MKTLEIQWLELDVIVPDTLEQPKAKFFDNLKNIFKSQATKETYLVKQNITETKGLIDPETFQFLISKCSNKCKGCNNFIENCIYVSMTNCGNLAKEKSYYAQTKFKELDFQLCEYIINKYIE